MKFKFSLKYLLFNIALFITEVIIATYLKDVFWIRAFFGDVLVVMLIYTFIKTFFEVKNENLLIVGIFIFSCIIETAQHFNVAEKLGFKPGDIMYIVIGNSFSWIDIWCYGAGCLAIWILRLLFSPKKPSTIV